MIIEYAFKVNQTKHFSRIFSLNYEYLLNGLEIMQKDVNAFITL